MGFLGVALLVLRWDKLFADFHYFKVVAYFAAQSLLFFLDEAIIKVIDWPNMVPDPEYSLIPMDVSGCINISVIYTYYRPDDIHNQYWIIGAIYFPLFLIFIFRFLWDSIKQQQMIWFWISAINALPLIFSDVESIQCLAVIGMAGWVVQYFDVEVRKQKLKSQIL